jgi:DNA end-binding protein Ku
MPRSLWNGTIVFGAVAVPIKLYSAIASKTVRFHEVHLSDGARIEHRTFCSAEGKEVPRDEIVKGFEVRAGRHVALEKEEIDAAGGTRGRIIDVEHFVPVAAIDPVFYDKAYVLGAQDDGADAFRLLHDVLEKAERAAIGRFTFHRREYLVAIRAAGALLALHTLRFADALVAPGDLDVPRASRQPDRREVAMARQLIESLHEPWRPDRLHDEYRKAVLAAIRRKAKGQDLAPPDEPEAEPPESLMAALEASLGQGKGKGKGKGKGTGAGKATGTGKATGAGKATGTGKATKKTAPRRAKRKAKA